MIGFVFLQLRKAIEDANAGILPTQFGDTSSGFPTVSELSLTKSSDAESGGPDTIKSANNASLVVNQSNSINSNDVEKIEKVWVVKNKKKKNLRLRIKKDCDSLVAS